jgi:flavin-dependent dehydrogenase
MIIGQHTYEVIIAGAGPAGSSAAIHLARNGVKVLLVEQKKFPRAKLCGEFISPECQEHFHKLGVESGIALSGPARLSETVFYASSGKYIRVPCEWFGTQATALGLSRFEMDHRLLLRAKELGVTVLEEATIAGVLVGDKSVCGIRVKLDGATEDYHSRLTIDATGRSRALVRKIENRLRGRLHVNRPGLVAFKAHLRNARMDEEACEIYSYKGGYGGLSRIENGLSNLCFIVSAKDVRRCNSDPEVVLRNVVTSNQRADYTLGEATASTDWLSVSLESFGRNNPVPYPGLIAVGDAAAFIDPFTGSGMLMAFESGELAAFAILEHLHDLIQTSSLDLFTRTYKSLYRARFNSRLRISGLIRRVAFFPSAAEAAILFFRASERLRRRIAQATHSTRDDPITAGSHASKFT